MTTLSDNEISTEIQAGKLVRNADLRMLEGATYQLRMGNVYYDLSEDGRRFALAPGESVLIKPGHRVALITAEEFAVPANILVRIVSKGSLFSVGLSPIATYADPGFAGNVGIVTENISDKYIQLPQDEPIAKAEFTRLETCASRTYQGQHGFKSGIWPIKTQFQKHYREIAGDPRVRSEKAEAFALLPEATRMVIRRMESTQFWTNAGLVIAILVNSVVIFLVENKLIDGVIGVIGSLVATAVVSIASLTASLIRRNA